MKLFSILISLALVLTTPARAETLQFAASVQNEDLAEESILLLHCLAERSGSPWEFTGETAGNHWLELKEKGKIAEGKYRHGSEETPIQLAVGAAEAVCGKIYPELEKKTALAPAEALPDLSTIAPPRPRSYWPWALGAAAALAVGYALLHSGGASHSSFTMN
jgi:hypothetical protein